MLPDLRCLTADEWPLLRDARLTALTESPHAFLATQDKETAYDQERWQDEFARGDWYVGEVDGTLVCLLGVTREPGGPPTERCLEYVWVAPEARQSGVAFRVLTDMLDKLAETGIRSVALCVLDGNRAALRLYERLKFQRVGDPYPVDDDEQGRSEQRFSLDLTRTRQLA